MRGNFEVSFLLLLVCLGKHHNRHEVCVFFTPSTLIDEANEQGDLGKWLSKDRDKVHYMFAMRVTEVMQQWPEMGRRERKWVSRKPSIDSKQLEQKK